MVVLYLTQNKTFKHDAEGDYRYINNKLKF